MAQAAQTGTYICIWQISEGALNGVCDMWLYTFTCIIDTSTMVLYHFDLFGRTLWLWHVWWTQHFGRGHSLPWQGKILSMLCIYLKHMQLIFCWYACGIWLQMSLGAQFADKQVKNAIFALNFAKISNCDHICIWQGPLWPSVKVESQVQSSECRKMAF